MNYDINTGWDSIRPIIRRAARTACGSRSRGRVWWFARAAATAWQNGSRAKRRRYLPPPAVSMRATVNAKPAANERRVMVLPPWTRRIDTFHRLSIHFTQRLQSVNAGVVAVAPDDVIGVSSDG